MKLLKPAWVSHDGLPIFSVDIHPDGSRFATGGQGQDCGRVVVWNMAPLINKDSEDDENIPKLLSQMDNHLACVNCVRWSMSGQWLASAGDDKTVMVWGSAGSESWRCVANLRAHTGDVLDLAWAPHDAWLASCSVDNTVIVWNALNLPEVVAVLKGHTGLVKGVTWDPVGKFLASQSDDKSLKIWRTSDWREDANIIEPFEECGGTTHVLRLSWSPDGQYLVSAHAMNGGGPTAQIVEREGWATDKDFVGHRKAVTCVRFNSNILLKAMPHSNKTQQYCCCAIGSRDRSLSVWLTALKRPLVVIKELFSSSVLDLSWSTGGLQLMACSWDGTVVYIQFSESEIGKPLSPTEKRALHERMYGKSASLPGLASASLLETPELLGARQGMQSPAKQLPSNTPRPTPVVRGPTDKQIETRTPDGKRRITPMFIPTTSDVVDGVAGTQQPTFSSSSEARSKIRVEKRDEVVSTKVTNQKSSPREQSQPLPSTSSEETPKSSQQEKPGDAETTDSRRAPAKVSKRGRPSHSSAPVNVVPTPSRPPASVNVHTQQQQAVVLHQDADEPRLPSLPTEKTVSAQVLGWPGHTLEASNTAIPSPYGALYQLKLIISNESTPIWETFLGSRVVSVAASFGVSLAACSDGTLHVFETAHGRRPLPPLALSAPAARLAASRTQALVLTTRARVSVWDVATKTAIVSDVSLAPLLLPDPRATVVSCLLTEKGCPAVTLSNGKAFMFSTQMQTWLVLGDGTDPVQQSSSHQTFASVVGTQGPTPPLCALQKACHRPSRCTSLVGGETVVSCTLSFLERQMASSRALGSSKDYHLWLSAFVRFLVHNGLEKRLRLILDELLGPAHINASLSKSWDPKIMGFSKHELLRESLKILASNLTLQRLYSEYNDQLEMISTKLNISKRRSSQMVETPAVQTHNKPVQNGAPESTEPPTKRSKAADTELVKIEEQNTKDEIMETNCETPSEKTVTVP